MDMRRKIRGTPELAAALHLERRAADATDERPVVTQRIGFFLVPNFSMMALSSATEPLRAANRMSGKPLYSWHL
ncbi:GlxA family transcriptional regulator, partial [Burkholderia sp. SIMBA_057]